MSLRGQSIIEFTVVLLVVVAVLLIMGYYVRGGLAGKFREAGDAYGQGLVYTPKP